ncbi:MAG TPA: NAD(P)H-dependent oxidoreductase subunit E [Roseiarcus sp.]|nr:NAD(P)H-dependent oxidoreductase subunit E [Roseiarcus sp.]
MTRKQAWDEALAGRLIEERKGADGALLPILHALQDAFGYIDRAAIAPIAAALNVSKADVHGVVSFYHDFRATPADGHVLKLCRAESCQAMGCEDLVDHLREAHGLTPDRDNGDGLHVETVYCLGNCALSPAAVLDGAPIGRLDAAKLDRVVRQAREAAP